MNPVHESYDRIIIASYPTLQVLPSSIISGLQIIIQFVWLGLTYIVVILYLRVVCVSSSIFFSFFYACLLFMYSVCFDLHFFRDWVLFFMMAPGGMKRSWRAWRTELRKPSRWRLRDSSFYFFATVPWKDGRSLLLSCGADTTVVNVLSTLYG